MATIIDAYNLMHACGLLRGRIGPGGLERSRLALLNFLAESLPADVAAKTIVVFDSSSSSSDMPGQAKHRGLTVRFAHGYDDADSLIEELIKRDHSPKSLTVVSSDRRVQFAAKRRRAKAVGSGKWYGQVCRERAARAKIQESPERPVVPLLSEDVDYWINHFGGEESLALLVQDINEKDEPVSAKGSLSADSKTSPKLKSKKVRKEPKASGKPKTPPGKRRRAAAPFDKPITRDDWNPFPPGYGDDLVDGTDLDGYGPSEE